MDFICTISSIISILFITTTNCWEINTDALSGLHSLQALPGATPNLNYQESNVNTFQPSLLTNAASNGNAGTKPNDTNLTAKIQEFPDLFQTKQLPDFFYLAEQDHKENSNNNLNQLLKQLNVLSPDSGIGDQHDKNTLGVKPWNDQGPKPLIPNINNIRAVENIQKYLDQLSNLYKLQKLNEILNSKPSQPLQTGYTAVLGTSPVKQTPLATNPLYVNQPILQYLLSQYIPKHSDIFHGSQNFTTGLSQPAIKSVINNPLVGGLPQLNDPQIVGQANSLYSSLANSNSNLMYPDPIIINYLVSPAILHSLLHRHLPSDFHLRRQYIPPNYKTYVQQDAHHVYKREIRNSDKEQQSDQTTDTSAKCKPGSHRVTNCKNCTCGEDLKEVCEPIPDCTLEPLSYHGKRIFSAKKCRPFQKIIIINLCTRCVCNRYSVPECTYKCNYDRVEENLY